VLIAALAATGGCDRKKAPNNTPAPKTTMSPVQTDKAMQAMSAASPASDPSLPEASTAMAALAAASSPTTVR
jgi:hypothetical protein